MACKCCRCAAWGVGAHRHIYTSSVLGGYFRVSPGPRSVAEWGQDSGDMSWLGIDDERVSCVVDFGPREDRSSMYVKWLVVMVLLSPS